MINSWKIFFIFKSNPEILLLNFSVNSSTLILQIIFSVDKFKEQEWLSYLQSIQINSQSSVYVKKIGFVSSEALMIKIQEKNICNIRVEELTEKFNNSISGYF